MKTFLTALAIVAVTCLAGVKLGAVAHDAIACAMQNVTVAGR